MKSSKRMIRALGLLFSYVCGGLYLAFQGGKVAGMIFAMMTVLAVYLILGRWSGIRKPQMERQILSASSGDELEAGTSLTVSLSLKIPGNWPIPYVIVKECLKGENGKTYRFEVSFVPNWKRQGSASYETPPLERGYYAFDTTECATEDVFGLLVHSGTVNVSQKVSVLPRTVKIRDWHDFNVLSQGGQHHAVSARAWRESTQIDGVREYVYGDRISRIHWNASARTGAWKSKEFERESLPKMMIVLDAERAPYESDAGFELAVSTAASLLKFAHQNGLSYGLLTTGKKVAYFPPDETRTSRQKMMQHLISIARDGDQPIENVMQDPALKIENPVVMLVTAKHPSEMEPVFRKIRAENGTGYHLFIRPNPSIRLNKADTGFVKTKTYVIDSLEELSTALGGRAR